MNKIYSLVWNTTLQSWIAVSELTRSGKKSVQSNGMITASLLLMLPFTASAATNTCTGTGPVTVSAGNSCTIESATVTSSGIASTNSALQASGANTIMNATNVSATSNGSSAGYASAGGAINIIGGLYQSSGTNRHAVVASGDQSQVNVNGAKLIATGASAAGAQAVYAGATVNITNSEIESTGTSAYGVYAVSQGQLNITDSTIKTSGIGLASLYAGSQIVAGNTKIEAQVGAQATTGTTISINGGSMLTNGYGLYASGTNGRVDLSDTSTTQIITMNADGTGAYARSGHIALDNDAIYTLGTAAYGLSADTNGTIHANKSSINTSGVSAYGVYALNGANIDLQQSNISTDGELAHGLVVKNALPMTLTGSKITTHGAEATGFVLMGPNSGNTGATKYQLSLLDDSHIISNNGIGAIIDGEADIDVRNASSLVGVSESGLALDILSNSKLNILFENGSQLNGSVRTAADGTSNVTLLDGSLWMLAGDSNISNLNNSRSSIMFTGLDNTFNTLTVNGDYLSDNGTLRIRTQLSSDDSLTDKVIVNGNTSGHTYLQVNNNGGTGDFTHNDGIQVIQVNGASDGVFSLAERVVAGTNEYLLFQGGKSTANDGNWYLRSEVPAPVIVPPKPTEPEKPETGETEIPGSVVPEKVRPPVRPSSLYRPEIGAYLGNQLAATNMFRHTLHQRLGELDFSEAQRTSEGTPGSVWLRVQRNDFTADTGSKQIDVDTTTDILQLGGDLARWSNGDSRYHLGVMAGIGHAKTDVNSNVLSYKAKGDVDGYSAGLYGTWYQSASQPTGAYIDTWLQFGRYNNSVKGDGLATEEYDSKTFSASVEAGYAFEAARGENYAWFIEPQAQVIYTSFDADKHREKNGTLVTTKDSQDVTTRLGARTYIRPVTQSTVSIQPFVETNWWHQAGDNSIAFNNSTMKLNSAKNVYEAKVGAEVALNKGFGIWGNVGKQFSAGEQRDVSGQIGVKYSW
ncbi:Outer membrane protein IcsA autotransporter precursor [Pragia fontium]|nr:autotransporter outer membrane beta-barrel domain-containing protein [Pragia fontium]SUB81625.1 Outer membrane protein IcsA autotransporter precursor [Pragia fontium]